jgi:hypothetical protein
VLALQDKHDPKRIFEPELWQRIREGKPFEYYPRCVAAAAAATVAAAVIVAFEACFTSLPHPPCCCCCRCRCALDKTCYCQEDIHCPEQHRCIASLAPGLESYKVCKPDWRLQPESGRA